MSLATTFEPRTAWPQLYRLTVRQYHKMVSSGILPDGAPYELIDGYLVLKDRSATGEDPMTQGDRHVWVVMRLLELNSKLARAGCHLRPQMPISLPPNDEPEPDAAIVRGAVDDFRNRKPSADDVACVLEVADSSLRNDRTVKQRIYATAGVPQYIIVNLLDDVIEVYSAPAKRSGRYERCDVLERGEKVRFATAKGKGLTIPVAQLLP